DSLQINADVVVGGNVRMIDHSGTSQLGINTATVGGDVFVWTDNGADVVSLSEATISGDVTFWAEKGDNLLSVSESTISGDLNLLSTRGHDDIVLDLSTVNGNVIFNTGDWMDSFALTNSTIGGNLWVFAGRHNDTVLINGLTVTGMTHLYMLQGQDNIRVQGTNSFGQFFFAGGILGKPDALELGGTNTFGGGQWTPSFESSTVSDALITSQITDGAVARADAARMDLGETTPLTLTVDTSSNNFIQAGNQDTTNLSTIAVTGTSTAGATIEVDLGGGTFTTATTTVGTDGTYTVDVPIAAGDNTVTIRATDGDDQLTQEFDIYRAVGTISRFVSNVGTFDVEFFDDDTPNHVANFLNYQTRFTNSIVHRVGTTANSGVDVIQGGGAVLNGTNLTGITTDAEVANEASSAHPNARGTIAAARTSDPDSATSQWYINTLDNFTLDSTANPFTVFGQVLGNGMDVVDTIYDTAISNISQFFTVSGVGLGTVPLLNSNTVPVQLTGTLTVDSTNLTTVTGTGTLFTTELTVGDSITIGDFTTTVIDIGSDTELILGTVATTAFVDATATTNNGPPAADAYIVFTSISTLLPKAT
ncbi:MAG: peptidylprolyl isomerase, partial [Planctomycetaceae bacterium]|nr:peptidylprolyl isomerase [Planctomycetaceae bacterium]